MDCILIVEDEDLERNFLQSLIETKIDEECLVWSCATGTQAVELAEKHRPNILFLDILIPEKDGLTVLKEVRTFLPDATVVIISAFSEFSYAQQAIDLKVFKYLLKPVKPREIEEVVRHVVGQQEKAAETSSKTPINDGCEETIGFVREAVRFIQKNFREKLTLEIVSAHVYMNPQYFSRVFKKRIGVSYTDYVNNLRIQHACKLLETSDFPSYRISNECGFNDPSYFNRVFFKQMKTTPNKYRKLSHRQFS
ncbi:response regulator transcription factor [Enterococcus malodoratus]|uniref:response regulator transcription factor n=1 Tax=Enterococcus malodoratus TaxID=71451 RepID=UPI003FCF987A